MRQWSKSPKTKRPVVPSALSIGEETLALQLIDLKPVREYKFYPDRRWRFDFAFPSIKLAVEVEGGIYSGGRHTRGVGYDADMEKYNKAAMSGWAVLRYSTAAVKSGRAEKEIRQTIASRL